MHTERNPTTNRYCPNWEQCAGISTCGTSRLESGRALEGSIHQTSRPIVRDMVGIQGHIIRPLGPLGPPADAWLQSNTRCPLEERGMQKKPCRLPRGTGTLQRHSGQWALSTYQMKLNTLKVGLAALEGLLERLL
jgi:hypothetical protein